MTQTTDKEPKEMLEDLREKFSWAFIASSLDVHPNSPKRWAGIPGYPQTAPIKPYRDALAKLWRKHCGG